jgi:hypothetical protein
VTGSRLLAVAKMLYSIEWTEGPPSLADVRERYGLAEGEVDEQFGVVPVDPDAGTYSVLVEDAAMARALGSEGAETAKVSGPYANPRIEPFDAR